MRRLCAILGVGRRWYYERPDALKQAKRDIALRLGYVPPSEFEAAGSIATGSHGVPSGRLVTAREPGQPNELTNREAGVV